LSIESGNLFAQQLPLLSYAGDAALANVMLTNILFQNAGGRFCPQNWLSRQRPLRDRKNSFRSIIYGERSTIPANFVKIGPVDVEIIGLTEITKIFFN